MTFFEQPRVAWSSVWPRGDLGPGRGCLKVGYLNRGLELLALTWGCLVCHSLANIVQKNLI
jgi:hypothetical protein